MRNRRKKFILFFILAPVAFAVFIFLGGEVVRRLWNWLLPSLFGTPQIRFWQALGLLVLCRILFGGFGMNSSGNSRRRERAADKIADRVAERVSERIDQMTPDERERIRERIHERWGTGPTGGETKPLEE